MVRRSTAVSILLITTLSLSAVAGTTTQAQPNDISPSNTTTAIVQPAIVEDTIDDKTNTTDDSTNLISETANSENETASNNSTNITDQIITMPLSSSSVILSMSTKFQVSSSSSPSQTMQPSSSIMTSSLLPSPSSSSPPPVTGTDTTSPDLVTTMIFVTAALIGTCVGFLAITFCVLILVLIVLIKKKKVHETKPSEGESNEGERNALDNPVYAGSRDGASTDTMDIEIELSNPLYSDTTQDLSMPPNRSVLEDSMEHEVLNPLYDDSKEPANVQNVTAYVNVERLPDLLSSRPSYGKQHSYPEGRQRGVKPVLFTRNSNSDQPHRSISGHGRVEGNNIVVKSTASENKGKLLQRQKGADVVVDSVLAVSVETIPPEIPQRTAESHPSFPNEQSLVKRKEVKQPMIPTRKTSKDSQQNCEEQRPTDKNYSQLQHFQPVIHAVRNSVTASYSTLAVTEDESGKKESLPTKSMANRKSRRSGQGYSDSAAYTTVRFEESSTKFQIEEAPPNVPSRHRRQLSLQNSKDDTKQLRFPPNKQQLIASRQHCSSAKGEDSYSTLQHFLPIVHTTRESINGGDYSQIQIDNELN